MIKSIERILFFLLILLLPVQLGKHFWPQFALINGIRVDYLSPTIYLTDILIFLLFLISIVKKRLRNKIFIFKFSSKDKFYNSLLLFVILDIVLLVFASRSQPAHFFGLVKFLEFLFLGFYIVRVFEFKLVDNFISMLSWSAFVASILAIMQYVNQSSIGGFWYFLGERTFTGMTIGIANMNIGQGQVLRPYAFFPHPNVLAFFLFFSSIFILFKLKYEKNIFEKIFLIMVFNISLIALLLTFSRVIIIISLIAYLFLAFTILRQKIYKYLLLGLSTLGALTYLALYPQRYLNIEMITTDLMLRVDLASIALKIISSNFYFGVGLNNFFIHEIAFQKTVSPTILQPVHNVFALIFVQVGFFSFLFVLVFIKKTFITVWQKYRKYKGEQKDFYQALFILLSALLIVGMFDHFPITLQQGQLITALIIGLAWFRPDRIRRDERK
ncbi:MAG: hypothetical protein COU27_02520 [Candidatus Levybacteria bacterium CG10_big_fil_rev_8_21_14_0_10_36_7]|nr:MAG: hypothetical protein COU27_02520 [Candidatus Levybacteria bacterium CG10_big_fil_rev_8_21_14_0_10_36_7]